MKPQVFSDYTLDFIRSVAVSLGDFSQNQIFDGRAFDLGEMIAGALESGLDKALFVGLPHVLHEYDDDPASGSKVLKVPVLMRTNQLEGGGALYQAAERMFSSLDGEKCYRGAFNADRVRPNVWCSDLKMPDTPIDQRTAHDTAANQNMPSVTFTVYIKIKLAK